MSTFTGSCLEAFLELANDHSHDRPTHPNTHALQDFIRQNVLPQGPREEQISSFLNFAKDVACRCSGNASLCETFHSVIQNIPGETPEQKRIRHAIDKVGLQLGLRQPV